MNSLYKYCIFLGLVFFVGNNSFAMLSNNDPDVQAALDIMTKNKANSNSHANYSPVNPVGSDSSNDKFASRASGSDSSNGGKSFIRIRFFRRNRNQ